METATLAIHGGQAEVTAQPPPNKLHGPSEIGEEEIEAVTKVLRSQILFRYTDNQAESVVAKFEKLFAEKTGATNVVAVNSGTSALICGLVGLGVSQGDEVLVPAYTYIATAAAVLALGAVPVLVEVDASLTMDALDLATKISPRTSAILPVHMRGMPCDMSAILEVARRHGLPVLEDCAQANGGTYCGKPLGRWGQAGAFSFQHFKIMTAGEGGALITNDRRIFERAAIYHDSAFTFWMETNPEFAHIKATAFLGENYRQSEVHAAIALEQLKKRDRILARCRAIKRRLWDAFASLPGAVMETRHDEDGDCGISLAFFMENAQRAQDICAILNAEGVACGTRFSKDVPDRHIFYHWDYIMEHRSPHRNGFPWNGFAGSKSIDYSKDMCPHTLSWMERLVVFPITQQMTDEFVDHNCSAIEKVARNI
ncbi:MAG: aminotransferase class I/II-fold pyridoxal phosphate-dependent enzyme [Chthoniobacterales bacterium]